MVGFKYNGKSNTNNLLSGYNNQMSEISLEASLTKIEEATNFVNENIKTFKCSNKVKSEVNIIIDEIFGNIAKYAYNKNKGNVNIQTFLTNSPLALNIIFEDSGIPYNPLNCKEIDKNLSAKDREYGGLGIGIVKDIVDDIKYEFINGKNRLTIKKNLETNE